MRIRPFDRRLCASCLCACRCCGFPAVTEKQQIANKCTHVENELKCAKDKITALEVRWLTRTQLVAKMSWRNRFGGIHFLRGVFPSHCHVRWNSPHSFKRNAPSDCTQNARQHPRVTRLRPRKVGQCAASHAQPHSGVGTDIERGTWLRACVRGIRAQVTSCGIRSCQGPFKLALVNILPMGMVAAPWWRPDPCLRFACVRVQSGLRDMTNAPLDDAQKENCQQS